MTSPNIVSELDKLIYQLGFELWGCAKIENIAEDISELVNFYFLNKFYATMEWLQKNLDVRLSPQKRFEKAKTIIVVAKNYYQPTLQVPISVNGQNHSKESLPKASISNYAIGFDYHYIMKEKLDIVAKFLLSNNATFATTYVDTGPIFEKYWAAKAGLGWIGKNSLLINRALGSFLFLGTIITDLEIQSNRAFEYKSFCGSCKKCLEACPTGAIVAEGVVDSNKCIAYLTIEHRGEIEPFLMEKMGNWIFGCDICQQVCPWNRKVIYNTNSNGWFGKNESLYKMTLLDMLNIDKEEFSRIFKDSTIKRAKWEGFIRNVIIVVANLKVYAAIEKLKELAFSATTSGTIKSTALWALKKLAVPDIDETLSSLQNENKID
jgi:epoxyqueuosine reductase